MDRMFRVNQQLKEEIGKILLQDLSDPRFELVTITAVKTSRDLRHARVYFSVLGNPPQVEAVKNGFESAAGMIRRLVGQRINMRNTPDFLFTYDESILSSARIEEKLKEVPSDHEESHQSD